MRGTRAHSPALQLSWPLLVPHAGFLVHRRCVTLLRALDSLAARLSRSLDDNQAEQDRCVAAGSQIGRSDASDAPDAPLRVWPGGLMFGRSIGDPQAGDAVIAHPDVRQARRPGAYPNLHYSYRTCLASQQSPLPSNAPAAASPTPLGRLSSHSPLPIRAHRR